MNATYSKAVGTREPTALPLRLAHRTGCLADVYCEDEPGRRSAAKLLTRDEARRIAANIGKLPRPLPADPIPPFIGFDEL